MERNVNWWTILELHIFVNKYEYNGEEKYTRMCKYKG